MFPYYNQRAPTNNTSSIAIVIVVFILVLGVVALYALNTPSTTSATPPAKPPATPPANAGNSEPIDDCPNLKRDAAIFVGCNHAYKDYETFKRECNIGNQIGHWIDDDFPGGSCRLKRGDRVYGCVANKYYVYGSASTRANQCPDAPHYDLNWVV